MDGNSQTDAPGWASIGRPLYRSDSAGELGRVGVVDVGSNSVRFVVFDGVARSPAYFYNEKIMCALGAGLSQTGRLNPKGRVRALNALKRFAALADGMGIAPLTAVATAAVRDADDGQAFCDEVERRHRHQDLYRRRRTRSAPFRAGGSSGMAGILWNGLRHRRLLDGIGDAVERRGGPTPDLRSGAAQTYGNQGRSKGCKGTHPHDHARPARQDGQSHRHASFPRGRVVARHCPHRHGSPGLSAGRSA